MCVRVSTNAGTKLLFLLSLLHTLNLLRPLSILFQMSFLHLLSLLTGHSASCKPPPSTSIALFTNHSTMNLLWPLSLSCPTSISVSWLGRLCMTEPLSIVLQLSHYCMAEPLSCSWVAEDSVVCVCVCVCVCVRARVRTCFYPSTFVHIHVLL